MIAPTAMGWIMERGELPASDIRDCAFQTFYPGITAHQPSPQQHGCPSFQQALTESEVGHIGPEHRLIEPHTAQRFYARVLQLWFLSPAWLNLR
ncbi:MAG: hypothetical protein AAFW84_26625 [Cyanobacteria bacterium J06635_15]